MSTSKKISLRRSLAYAISAAVLCNAAPALADDVDAGDTYNQATPIGNTQRDHNISQPNAFGTDPSDEQRQQENRAADANDKANNKRAGESDRSLVDQNNRANDGMQSSDSALRGTLVNAPDGTRQIHLSTGGNQQQAVTADALLDRKIVNLQNKKIGEVEEVVQSHSGGVASLVVEAGGFMGIGEKEILVPLDEVRLSGNQLIWETQMGASELKESEQYHYQEDRFSSVADD